MLYMYLQFGSFVVKGEFVDKDYQGWIELKLWDYLIVQLCLVIVLIVGGYMMMCCEYGDMIFMKEIDLLSLLLYQYVLGGIMFDEVMVYFLCVDGEGKCVQYLEVKFKYVIILSIVLSVCEEGLFFEMFLLKYVVVQWK